MNMSERSVGGMGRGPLRIVVLDDDHVVRSGVAAMLEPRPDLFTPLAARTRELPLQGADIALRDVAGASISQLRDLRVELLQRQLRHVVAFVWQFSPAEVQQYFELGFAGVVSKRVQGIDLMRALLQVNRGRRVVLEGTPRAEIKTTAHVSVEQFHLAPRERQMLTCIGQGMTNEEISQQTGLGINTVKSYTRTAYRKVGLRSRAIATAWALNHLGDLDEPAPSSPTQ